jgi:hypothetical protein
MEGTFRMKRRQLTRTMRDGIALLAITAACGSDSKGGADNYRFNVIFQSSGNSGYGSNGRWGRN